MVKLIVSYTKDIRCSAVGSAWFVSAEELGGSDQGRFSEEKIPSKNMVNVHAYKYIKNLF